MSATQTQFVPYAGFVSDIKKTYSKGYIKAQHALGVHVREYRLWDKTDLLALYNSYFGRGVFDHLVCLVGEARQEERAQQANPTQKIYAFAQDDLNEIAPLGMDWKYFDRLVTETMAEVKSASFKVTNALADRFKSATAQDAANGFDPQAALAQLDAVQVLHVGEPAEPLAYHA